MTTEIKIPDAALHPIAEAQLALNQAQSYYETLVRMAAACLAVPTEGQVRFDMKRGAFVVESVNTDEPTPIRRGLEDVAVDREINDE